MRYNVVVSCVKNVYLSCEKTDFMLEKEDSKLLEGLASDSFIVGLRTCVKAIEKGNAERAFVAADVAPAIHDGFIDLCKEFDVPVEEVPSKAALGKACHIDVDASVVVVRKR